MKYLIVLIVLLSACKNENKEFSIGNDSKVTEPIVVDKPIVEEIKKDRVSLSWELKDKTRAPWSDTVLKVTNEEWDKIKKAQDFTYFCNKFDSLDEEKKKLVFAELIVAIAYFESAWKLNSWMKEPMGIDPITKKQVRSEGLMQLSYQDIQWAPYCKFDWSKDKLLDENDLNKTIFNPHINLECSIKIMSRQIEKKGYIRFKKGQYWAVILEGGKYEQSYEIKKMVNKNVKECSL